MTDGEVRELIDRARVVHPDVEAPLEAFVALVTARVAELDVPSLDDLPVPDLWLAAACASGDPAGLRAFERRTFPDARATLARMGVRADEADEVMQIVRQRLLVPPEPGASARITSVAGRGDLGGLVKVVAVRTALNLRRRDRRIVTDRDEQLFAAIASDDINPEVAALKAEHRAAFKQAVEDVVRELEPRDRNVLRMHVIHELSIDDIGRTYGVHRATAARWLTTIRERIEAGTRAMLQHRLGLEGTELDSLFGAIESRIAVSFGRVLATLHDS